MRGNEQRVRELGLELPVLGAKGNYVPARLHGNLLYLSGNGPVRPDGSMVRGVVGDDVSVHEAQEAARLTTLNLLGAARAAVGDLDRIDGVVNVLGYVRAIPEFTDHPAVIDACSDLLASVFGEAGSHSRAAIGVASLPFGLPVEITTILSVAD